MKPTHQQKRIMLKLVEPGLRLVYGLWRLLTLELFRDHRLPGDPRAVRRILVVRLDSIGDVLLSEPAIAALRQRFLQARLDVLVGAGGEGVLAGSPDITTFLRYEAPWHAAWRGHKVSWVREVGRWWRTVWLLQRQRYDLAIELRGDFRDILLMAFSGARVKVGNSTRGGAFLLDYDVPLEEGQHRVTFTLGIVGAVGASITPRPPHVYLDPPERERARSLLPSAAPAPIAFHLGAGFASKRLPVEKFAEVARLLQRGDGSQAYQTVVVGGPEDRPLLERFQHLVPFASVDLVGQRSLRETAAVLERCCLFIGNDSAPMHLAAAVGTPVVCFFGPSSPAQYHPYGVPYRLLEVELPCRPCDHVHCIHGEYLCMTQQSVEAIVTAARELLSQGKPSGPLEAAGGRQRRGGIGGEA